ncbi:hypothetical protein K402DRAFT_420729 [Aulographum hederae CBS 113979]|uniref:Uncharacterized protein n=1 Tax=Aulographum hederae CBS 113979 TaxID=1176131 RepID=A0A6G1H1K3_9PEZI|nr:hypothetical protein K402DRAFT_420729 [Aulographum hederae CBS 113979]
MYPSSRHFPRGRRTFPPSGNPCRLNRNMTSRHAVETATQEHAPLRTYYIVDGIHTMVDAEGARNWLRRGHYVYEGASGRSVTVADWHATHPRIVMNTAVLVPSFNADYEMGGAHNARFGEQIREIEDARAVLANPPSDNAAEEETSLQSSPPQDSPPLGSFLHHPIPQDETQHQGDEQDSTEHQAAEPGLTEHQTAQQGSNEQARVQQEAGGEPAEEEHAAEEPAHKLRKKPRMSTELEKAREETRKAAELEEEHHVQASSQPQNERRPLPLPPKPQQQSSTQQLPGPPRRTSNIPDPARGAQHPRRAAFQRRDIQYPNQGQRRDYPDHYGQPRGNEFETIGSRTFGSDRNSNHPNRAGEPARLLDFRPPHLQNQPVQPFRHDARYPNRFVDRHLHRNVHDERRGGFGGLGPHHHVQVAHQLQHARSEPLRYHARRVSDERYHPDPQPPYYAPHETYPYHLPPPAGNYQDERFAYPTAPQYLERQPEYPYYAPPEYPHFADERHQYPLLSERLRTGHTPVFPGPADLNHRASDEYLYHPGFGPFAEAQHYPRGHPASQSDLESVVTNPYAQDPGAASPPSQTPINAGMRREDTARPAEGPPAIVSSSDYPRLPHEQEEREQAQEKEEEEERKAVEEAAQLRILRWRQDVLQHQQPQHQHQQQHPDANNTPSWGNQLVQPPYEDLHGQQHVIRHQRSRSFRFPDPRSNADTFPTNLAAPSSSAFPDRLSRAEEESDDGGTQVPRRPADQTRLDTRNRQLVAEGTDQDMALDVRDRSTGGQQELDYTGARRGRPRVRSSSFAVAAGENGDEEGDEETWAVLRGVGRVVSTASAPARGRGEADASPSRMPRAERAARRRPVLRRGVDDLRGAGRG